MVFPPISFIFLRTKPWTIYPEHSVPLDWREAEQIFDQVDGGRQVGRQAGQAGGREGAHTLNCSTTYPATKPLPGLGGRLGHGSHRYESRSRFALENSPKLQSSVVLILIPKETRIRSIDFLVFSNFASFKTKKEEENFTMHNSCFYELKERISIRDS